MLFDVFKAIRLGVVADGILPGRRDGQKFGQALHHAKQNGLEDIEQHAGLRENRIGAHVCRPAVHRGQAGCCPLPP